MTYIDPVTTKILTFPLDAALADANRRNAYLESEVRRLEAKEQLQEAEIERRDFPQAPKHFAGSVFQVRTMYLKDWLMMKNRSWSGLVSADTAEVVKFFQKEIEWSMRFKKGMRNPWHMARNIMRNLEETDSRFETFLDGDKKKVLVIKYTP